MLLLLFFFFFKQLFESPVKIERRKREIYRRGYLNRKKDRGGDMCSRNTIKVKEVLESNKEIKEMKKLVQANQIVFLPCLEVKQIKIKLTNSFCAGH